MGRSLDLLVVMALAWLLLLPSPPPCRAQVSDLPPVLWVTAVAPGGRNVTGATSSPAVLLALEDLRRRAPLPGGSQVHLQPLDSQCDSSRALKGLFDAMWEGPGHMMIFGGACPLVTAVLARALHALNMVQLSFAAVPAELSDRRRYPNFFSTVPSDRAFNGAVVQLLQHYSWSRVGIVTQEGARLSQMRKNLVNLLTKVNVQITETQSVSEHPCQNLKRLKDSDVRIIVAQMEESSASKVLCCAYQHNLFGSRYQWILSSGPDQQWTLEPELPGCPLEALWKVLEGSIRVHLRQLSDTNIRGISGRTPLEYEQAYLSEVRRGGAPAGHLHGYAYDSVWVIAKALSHVTQSVKHRERHGNSRNLTVTHPQMTRMLLEALRQTTFEGVTGPVLFQNGERVASVELWQYQATREMLVGQYNTYTQKLRLFPDMLKFSGSGPPADRAFILLRCSNIDVVLYGVVTSVAAVAFVTTLTFLFVNILHCKCRQPRPPRRPLDNLLLLGILLCLSWVPLARLDGSLVPDWVLEPLCSVRVWFLTLGHCVGFSVLFTRSLKIYSLLIQGGSQQKNSKHSCWPPAAMLLLDVCVLSCWQVVDPPRRVEHSLEGGPVAEQASVRSYVECCVSVNMDLWLTALYAYKGPLLGLGCFLAWTIAGVQEVPPESRRLALSVGTVAVASSLGALSSLLTSHQPQLQFLLSSLAILSCSASLLHWGVHAKPWPAESSEMVASGEASRGASPVEGATTERSERTCRAESRGRLECLTSENQLLQRQRTQLDEEIASVTMEMEQAQISHQNSQDAPGARNHSREEDINSPEHVRRRRSLQLPILHHAYHPAVGGMAHSRSSLSGSTEASSTEASSSLDTRWTGTPPATSSQV